MAEYTIVEPISPYAPARARRAWYRRLKAEAAARPADRGLQAALIEAAALLDEDAAPAEGGGDG